MGIRFVLIGLLVFANSANASVRCEKLFKALASYQIHNPSAQMGERQYPYPNRRSLNEIDEILLASGESFRKLVPDGGTIMEVGAGYGEAMKEIAGKKKVHAIAINTQALSESNGNFTYLTGFAEEILPRLPSQSVDIIIDPFGALTYSPERARLLEEYYRLLKPGGAFFGVLSVRRVPVFVSENRKPIHLVRWLESHHPDIFSSHLSQSLDYEFDDILVMRKSTQAPQTLRLGLPAPTILPGNGSSPTPHVVYDKN